MALGMTLLNLICTFILLAFVYRTISTLIRNKLRATLTAVDDLLGIPRKEGDKFGGTAVICGGSIAGLLSARVCSDHFENVVMVEPEEWVTTDKGLEDHHRHDPSSPTFQRRSRVPQYGVFHGFQSFTTTALRKLFKNFDSEIPQTGGRSVLADAKFHFSGIPVNAPLHKYKTTDFPTVLTLTRAGYETFIRRLVVSTCSNVKYIPGTVTALTKSDSSNIVSDVRIRNHDGKETSLPATLVVDCTGPALGGLRWLQNLTPSSTKTQTPKTSSIPLDSLKTTYDAKVSYTTTEFDVPPRVIPAIHALGFTEDFESEGFLYVCFASPKLDNRNLIIGRKEHNFLQFACGGWDVRERIETIDDIKDFISNMRLARPLPEWIFRLLDLFEEERVPFTNIYARCPPSVYVQYHLAEGLPSNFIALGDSVLQLNPIRGHGCTKACVEAVTLNGCLTKCTSPTSDRTGKRTLFPKDFGQRFFSLQRKRTGVMWNTYRAEDYAWKTTSPARGDDLEHTKAWRRKYGAALSRLIIKDTEVSSLWWHTSNWLAPSTDLFMPNILLKLAWLQLLGYFGL